MELNQSTLRGILAQILSVDESYIVPKQGNWWNPQTQSEKPNNWCAYRISSNKPRTAPFYSESSANKNRVLVEKIATIELQFVGPDSESIAENVCTWPLRSDVKEAFETVQGAIMYNDMAAFSSPFYQDGTNNVLAWNVNFQVLWISTLETSQQIVKSVVFQ